MHSIIASHPSTTRLSSAFVACQRLGLCLALVLLTGCVTASHPATATVTTPPPPMVGSAPITAYDDCALAVFGPWVSQPKALAATVSSQASGTY